MRYRYSEQMKNLTAKEMKNWFQLYQEKAPVNLFSGNPSRDCLPVEELRQITGGFFEDVAPEAFCYTTGLGYGPLRVQLAAYARMQLHIGTSEDTVLVTEGASQAFYSICKVFCDQGDGVICDQLTSPFVIMMLKQQGLEVIPVEMDNAGMVPERLEAILSAHTNVKLIYLNPDFQIPTGVSIPESRRQRLIQVAERFGIVIIEDASTSQIRLYEDDLPPMKAFDTQNTVIYVGSFSHVLSPGFRVGYVIAGKEIITRLAAYNQIHASGGSSFTQMLCASYLKNYSLPGHIDDICERYRGRYEEMSRQIEEKFPEDIYFSQPDGGLYLWCTDVSEQINALRLASRLYEKYGIRIAAGNLFSVEEERYSSSFCLNYTLYEGQELSDIMDKIAMELKEMMPGF